jgi:polyphosphate kinase 2 (PPK2 family)
VLVVRVHPELLRDRPLPDEALGGHHIWKHRFSAINGWERYLTDNGFKVVKIFLNLSKEEQRVRLLRRIDLPDHNWKFSTSDLAERERWDDYQHAFSEMLSHTSTEWAPWYVIPADRKWFARVGAAAVIANALIELDPKYPRLGDEALQDLQAAKARLEAEAPDGAAADPFAAAAGRGG